MPTNYNDINEEMARMYFETVKRCISNNPSFICYSPYYADPDKQTIIIYYTLKDSSIRSAWRYASCQRVIDICKEIGYGL